MNQDTDVRPLSGLRGLLARALVPGVLAGACLLLAPAGPSLREALRFEREGLQAGQLWRLVTAHWVHLGWTHALLNVTALGVVWALFADVMSRRDWLAAVLLSMAAIDAGLYWLDPGVEWYVGLSGVLHGVVLVGAFRLWSLQPGLAALLLAALAAKLVWEGVGGVSPWAELLVDGPVVVAAHRYGALGAALYPAALIVRRIFGASL